MISVKGLKKTFGKTPVLKGLSLEMEPANVVAVMGPNGSGKTTFLKCILSLIVPDEGVIAVNGQNIRNSFTYRKQIGYMPQIARYPENLKVKELLSMISDVRNSTHTPDGELLEVLRLHELYNKKIGTLSGGQRQRMSAVLSFMFNQDILILDEPTAGLDPLSSAIVRKKIKNERDKGKLIMITTHISQEAEEMADRLVYIMDGTILLNNSIENIAGNNRENLGEALAGIIKINGH